MNSCSLLDRPRQKWILDFMLPIYSMEYKHLINSDLTFYLKSGTNPIIFEADTEDFSMTYLVMPVSPTVA